MRAYECDPSWTAERWSRYVHLNNGGKRSLGRFDNYGTDLHDVGHSPDDTSGEKRYSVKYLLV